MDRGFRDSIKNLKKYGFKSEMRAFLNPNAKQLTCEQANNSRKVTIVRYAVEVSIGKL